jgi:hypothetical protein
MNRRCQILSSNTPTDLLVDLSKKANIEAKTYVVSFVHSIAHVCNQYIGMGKPPKGVRGATYVDPAFQVSTWLLQS